MTNYQIATFEDNDFTLDVRVDIINKTIWLSMKEIMKLFGKSKPTISKSISKVYEQNSLKNGGIGKKYETVLSTRNRLYEQALYNLDLIKEIGVLVKSNRGILLEKFLLEYLMKTDENNTDIIIYNNGEVSLDVRISPLEETVWLNQNQIAELFDTSQQNVSLHIQNILNDGEVLGTIHKDFLYMGNNGQEYSITLYNLDIILAVGYRVKSKRAIEFRRWATHVLKKYLLQGYAIDEQRVLSVRNIVKLENDVNELKEKVDDIEKRITNKSINGKLFAQGTYYDAHEFICSLIMKAEKELIIVDPYFDLIGLSMLEKSKVDISRIIIISKRASLNEVDINRFTSQYGQLEILFDDSFHDRFLIIDREEFYSLGTSLNYLGNKIFGVNKIEEQRMTDLLMDIIEDDINKNSIRCE